MYTKIIRYGLECPEAGVYVGLDQEEICNEEGKLIHGFYSSFYLDPPSGSGVIPCDPLPDCRIVTIKMRDGLDTCPDHGVTYHPIVELSWSNPTSDGALADPVEKFQIWRLHSQGAHDDGEGVTPEDWDLYGRGNWQLIHEAEKTETTFQDGSEGFNSSFGTTGSWATYPYGKITYVAGTIPSPVTTSPDSDGQGYSLSTLTTIPVDVSDPESWWGLAKDCLTEDCLPHKYKYLVIALNKCGSLLWTSTPELLDFYTGSNSIDAVSPYSDGSLPMSENGDTELASGRITEWQWDRLALEGCSSKEISIPCCNLVPCADNQSFYVDCNLTSTGSTNPLTNSVVIKLAGNNSGGPTCFHTTSNPVLSPSNGADLGQLYFSCPDTTAPASGPCPDYPAYPTGSIHSTGFGADTDGDGVGNSAHPCHGGGANSSATGFMTYIPPINWSGSVTFNWKHETICDFTASATVTINVHCPTCIDEEKRYNICDATIEQLSAEHPKAAGVEQVPFSLYRKGPGSLRTSTFEKATATFTFTDKPNEETTITITDAAGTSVVFEVDDTNDGDGDTTITLSNASNWNSNTSVNVPSAFSGGAVPISGSAYVVTKGYDGLTVSGSNS
jgi:hypothetical protein